jgi:hypothetical protein
MPTFLIIFITAVWMLGSILGGMMEQVNFGSSTDISMIQALLSFNQFTDAWVGGNIVAIPGLVGDWIGMLAQMLVWDFAMFEDPWLVYIKYFFWTISIGVVMTIGFAWLSLLRGT